ncbi:MAG: hypothetical protein K0V04_21200, partial [Deltaproteobacteria bacterium]|nr:hypothetical protein [Deltaproteobacteria bacterium]
ETTTAQTTGGDTAATNTSSGGAASTGMATDDTAGSTADPSTGGSSGAADSSSGGNGSSSGGMAAIPYAQIQLELENANGEYGPYPSCTNGASCHSNPARNVHIIPNPTPEEMMDNWLAIVNVPQGVTPWVTPLDGTAQMLNEVPVPDDVRARWLEWIQAGAPFE